MVAAAVAIPTFGGASGHREGPGISQDPTARDGKIPTDASSTSSVIGVYATAERPALVPKGGPGHAHR